MSKIAIRTYIYYRLMFELWKIVPIAPQLWHLFLKANGFYSKPGDKIADITFGKGAFWNEIDTSEFDLHTSDIMASVDRPFDFQDLPYGKNEFDVVVFDPPYSDNPGDKLVTDNYQNSQTTKDFFHKDIIEHYKRGMTEAKRILKKNGYLFVKCQDEVESSA